NNPVATGPCRRTICRNWAKKNAPLKMQANKRNPAALPAEKARIANKRIGISGVSVRNSQPMNTTSAIAPPASADDLGASPTRFVSPDQTPDKSEGCCAHQRGTGVVQTARGTCVFLEPHQSQRDQHRSDRYVDPEDPLPCQVLYDRAADERPSEGGQSGDRCKQSQRSRPLSRSERSRQHGQGRWRHRGGASAL